MGVLDLVRAASSRLVSGRSGGRRTTRTNDDTLFDDEFQRKLEYLSLVSRRVCTGALRAERRSKKIGSGVEFADHREYVPGDDFRHLDWRAYGRHGKLLLRLFEEEEDLSIHFLIDTSKSMGFGDGRKLVFAKQLAAALAYVGLSNLDRVTMLACGDEVTKRLEPTRNKRRIFRVFKFLSALRAEGATDLGRAMRSFVAQHARRGLAVVLSDLYDPAGFEQGINVLRYNRFEPLVLHLVDPSDAAPPLRGDLCLYDCETGVTRDVTVTKKVLDRYSIEYNAYLRRVRRFCASRQVGYFRADVSLPFDDLVLRVLRRGGFLR